MPLYWNRAPVAEGFTPTVDKTGPAMTEQVVVARYTKSGGLVNVQLVLFYTATASGTLSAMSFSMPVTPWVDNTLITGQAQYQENPGTAFPITIGCRVNGTTFTACNIDGTALAISITNTRTYTFRFTSTYQGPV